MRLICMLAICLAVASCGGNRDETEYSLDERSFDAATMAKIQQESGIHLPDGAKGLAFHYISPIDPIVFAKIQIPTVGQDSIRKQTEALSFSGTSFPENFANGRCKWWPGVPQGVILSKQAFNNGHYIELYLVRENDDMIIYLKYFTI